MQAGEQVKAKRYRINAESGITLSGLLGALVVLGAIALVLIKVTPAWIEYRAIKGAIVKAKVAGGEPRAIREAFDKNAEVNNVDAIRGRDLMIDREDGQVQVAFRYEKRVPLVGNTSLLFDFAGTTDPSGVVPDADKAAQ